MGREREKERSVMRLRDGLQSLYLREKVFLDLCVCNGRLRGAGLVSKACMCNGGNVFNSRWPRGKVGKWGEQMVASGVSYRKGKDRAPKKKAMRLARVSLWGCCAS